MSDTWCPLPWIHQFITTTGVKMCCSSLHEEQCSPAEFENSQVLNDVKESILAGQRHHHCSGCFHLESNGLNSTRKTAIRDYPHLNRENIEHKVEYYDLRYSNLCNFSCRTCDTNFSSSIGIEVETNNTLKKYYQLTPRRNIYDDIISSVLQNIHNVKRIQFTGGEPLLIKDNLKILEYLIDLGKTDTEILITTNCSVINTRWANALSKFKTVHWTLSLDGVGKIAEYVRNGSVWNEVVKNVDYILGLNHSVAINFTMSAYSALGVGQLVEYFVERKRTVSCPFELWINTCSFPRYLHPSVLTDELEERARKEIEKSIELLYTVSDNPAHSIDELENILKVLGTCNNAFLLNKFATFTEDLDLVRNQSFKETFNLEIPHVRRQN